MENLILSEIFSKIDGRLKIQKWLDTLPTKWPKILKCTKLDCKRIWSIKIGVLKDLARNFGQFIFIHSKDFPVPPKQGKLIFVIYNSSSMKFFQTISIVRAMREDQFHVD